MKGAKPFWSYEDLMLFLGATLPAFVIASFAVRPIHFPNDGVRQVAFQSLLYLFIGIGSLIVGFSHRRSFCWAFPLLVSIVPSRLPIGIG